MYLILDYMFFFFEFFANVCSIGTLEKSGLKQLQTLYFL
jgi:hypothetical protein